jgi:hypothetical protein
MALEKVTVPNARSWLSLYIAMNTLDEIKAIVTNGHWMDHLHHIATGIGFSLDLVLGTDRTHALAVMALSSELVSPFYQLFAVLKELRQQDTPFAKLVVLSSIVVTACVRVPLSFGLAYVACRDSLVYLRCGSTSGAGSASDTGPHGSSAVHSKKHKEGSHNEIQPHLLLPGAFGCLMILYLDNGWVSDWAFPKLRPMGGVAQGVR